MKIKKTSFYKRRIAKRDGVECKMCGERSVPELTVDHIVPIALGGSTGVENLQFLCKECHVKKDKYVGQIGFGGRKKHKEKINKRKALNQLST